MKNLNLSAYLLLMWALVLTPGTALSETWDQKLDLTIPSLEMPLTWQLDSKAKHEIMLGWTCCYHPSLVTAVQKEHSLKLTESRLKEKQKKLRFIQIRNEPSEAQLKYFYAINFLDMAGSYYFIKNNPNIKEGNFLLPERPSPAEFIIHKGITVPLVAQNAESTQMTIMNSLLTIVVLRNWYLFNTTTTCRANFHVDGHRMPCLR